MPPDSKDAARLWDMLDAARAVEIFVSGREYRDYESDRMLRGAVERHLEVIGEAASKVSNDIKSGHPEIPWRQIIGLRHVLAHEYGAVRHDLIWRVANERIRELIRALETFAPPADKE